MWPVGDGYAVCRSVFSNCTSYYQVVYFCVILGLSNKQNDHTFLNNTKHVFSYVDLYQGNERKFM